MTRPTDAEVLAALKTLLRCAEDVRHHPGVQASMAGATGALCWALGRTDGAYADHARNFAELIENLRECDRLDAERN